MWVTKKEDYLLNSCNCQDAKNYLQTEQVSVAKVGSILSRLIYIYIYIDR